MKVDKKTSERIINLKNYRYHEMKEIKEKKPLSKKDIEIIEDVNEIHEIKEMKDKNYNVYNSSFSKITQKSEKMPYSTFNQKPIKSNKIYISEEKYGNNYSRGNVYYSNQSKDQK